MNGTYNSGHKIFNFKWFTFLRFNVIIFYINQNDAWKTHLNGSEEIARK